MQPLSVQGKERGWRRTYVPPQLTPAPLAHITPLACSPATPQIVNGAHLGFNAAARLPCRVLALQLRASLMLPFPLVQLRNPVQLRISDSERDEAEEQSNDINGALHHTERALQMLRHMRQRATMLQLELQYSRQELESHLGEVELEAAQVEGIELAIALSRSHSDGASSLGMSLAEVNKRMPAGPFASLTARSVVSGAQLPGGGECSICQEALAPDDVVRVLPCLHVHHQCCIDPWFERSTLCPVCRGSASDG